MDNNQKPVAPGPEPKLNPIAAAAAWAIERDREKRNFLIAQVLAKDPADLCSGGLPGRDLFAIEFLQKYPFTCLGGAASLVYLPFLYFLNRGN